MSLIRNLSAFAFAGAVGIAGTASAHPQGTPPEGSMRADFSARVVQDGRGETGGDVARSTIDRGFLDKSDRPDKNVGQSSHMVLPIKSEIALHVSSGDGPESNSGPSMNQSRTESQSAAVKGFAKPAQLPISFKTEVLLQISAGGEASVDSSGDRDSDDPKRARANSNGKTVGAMHANGAGSATTDGSHMSTKVYQVLPKAAPYTAFMTHGKTASADSDAPGDKDAP